MKKSKKIILQTATFMAAISLCAGFNVAYMPIAKADAAAVTVSAQDLADKKTQAKADLAAYFDGMTESAYGEAEWAAIAKIESEGYTFIEKATDAAEVDEIVASILNLDYMGIDLLFGKDGEPVLCEVNSNAYFTVMDEVCGVKVAAKYAEYIVENIKNLKEKL